jgi:hypothetical protein
MAALAVFQTGAFAGGAELAAVIFTAFRYACAGVKYAIAIRMGTRFFSHGQLPPDSEEAVIVPLRPTTRGCGFVPVVRGVWVLSMQSVSSFQYRIHQPV